MQIWLSFSIFVNLKIWGLNKQLFCKVKFKLKETRSTNYFHLKTYRLLLDLSIRIPGPLEVLRASTVKFRRVLIKTKEIPSKRVEVVLVVVVSRHHNPIIKLKQFNTFMIHWTHMCSKLLTLMVEVISFLKKHNTFSRFPKFRQKREYLTWSLRVNCNSTYLEQSLIINFILRKNYSKYQRVLTRSWLIVQVES